MKDRYINSRFNRAPTISKPRTRFDLSHNTRFTCNTGDFVCIGCEEIYPGETVSLKDNNFIRLETSLHQTMDTAYYEEAHFFVPLRQIWTDFDKFMGANDDPWVQENEYSIPQIFLRGGSIAPMSLMNQIYAPSGVYVADRTDPNCIKVSALPLRAVFQVWNDYYRDENYDTIIAYSKASVDVDMSKSFSFNNGVIRPSVYSEGDSDHILRVNRFHDLFSSVLPAPQRGDPVSIGLSGTAPVYLDDIPLSTFSSMYSLTSPIKLGSSDASEFLDNNFFNIGLDADAGSKDGILSLDPDDSGSHPGTYPPKIDRINLGVKGSSSVSKGSADLSEATAITINQLRLAIISQSIKEREARSGTRPNELIYSIWGVNSNSLELDRPEFLSGRRIPITMMEVLQTSATGTTVLGTSAGHSKTFGSGEGFVKSFTEYGLLMSFAYIRTQRSYSQGINKKFFKVHKYDFYDTLMDNIGEVDVRGKELLALNTSGIYDEDYLESPIGYQEPWYHLKSELDRDFGYFQTGISGTLDSWHYGDSYPIGSEPVIDYAWLKESPAQVDRTIAVSSGIAHQWAVMVHQELYITRQMNLYNIPNTFGFGSK